MSTLKCLKRSRNQQPVNYKDDPSDLDTSSVEDVTKSLRTKKPVNYRDSLSELDSSSFDDVTQAFRSKKAKTADPEFEIKNQSAKSESSSSGDDQNSGDDDDGDRESASSTAPWDDPKLSEYERTILKNIEARNQYMREMGFPEAVRDLKKCLSTEQPKKPKKKPAKKVIKKKESPLPLREPSRRLRKIAAKKDDELKTEIQEEEDKENEELVDNRLLDSKEMSEDMYQVLTSGSDNAVYNPDLNLAECSVTAYKDQLASLKMLSAYKMMPSRIMSMSMHPLVSKTIFFAGDKYGNFGISVLNEEPKTFQVHQCGLNRISVAREDHSKVYTTGHDGAMVQIDFNARKFINVYATDFTDRVSHLTWHDEFESQKFLVGHGRGDVGILDSRAGKVMQKWVDCFPRSVKTVQHHPTQQNYFVAASGTGTLKIFDLRNSEECVTVEEFDKSLSSAFFSPSGTKILTTSHDDRVRVFDSSVVTTKLRNVASYMHNNFTGRWLTPFRADWVPRRDDVFHVGSLLHPRRIQFYKADNSGILLDVTKELETVACVITMHPTLPFFAGANSSGKVHLFGPSEFLGNAPAE